MLALVLYSIAYASYGFAATIEWMYAARLLQGLGAALLLLTIDAITTDIAPQNERASAMGKNVEVQTRSTLVGATIGFSLVGFLPEEGWKFSFLIFTLLAGYATFVAVRSVPESAPVTTSQTELQPVSAAFVRLLVMFVPLGFANALMMPIYLVYLQDLFTPDVGWLSWAFLPAGLVFAILPSRLGALVDRYGAIWPCALALFAVAALYLILPELDHFWSVAIFTINTIQLGRSILMAS